MINILVISVLLGLSSLNTPNPPASENWNFIKNDSGMKLYNRNVEGFSVKEIKVVFPLDAEINKVKDYLYSPENIVNWMASCTFSKSEEVFNKHKFYYAIYKAPWPITDRDDYGQVRLLKHTATELKLDFRSIPDGKPISKQYVRVPYSKGQIYLFYNQDGQLQMEYQLLVDRGGTLPEYIREYLETNSPLNTAKNLKGQLENI